MALVSVFTPVHPAGVQWLAECHESLKAQTLPADQWEWVIVANEGAEIPAEISSPANVRVVVYPQEDKPDVPRDGKNPAIGAKKRFACEQCYGDIYVELDCDDMLAPTALEKIQAAVNDGAGFVYSDFAEFVDKTWAKRSFNSAMHWEEYPCEYQGHKLTAQRAWPPIPQSFLTIHWAPNHVRAWSKEVYWRCGGHKREFTVADDHEMNVRTYIEIGSKGCHHITEPLYLYRVKGYDETNGNTCFVNGKAIREMSREVCDRMICDVAMRWSRDEGLRMLDLGGKINAANNGMEVVDIDGGDIQADLNDPWPFEESSVGVARAYHLLEHLRDPVHTMNELYRVLAPGGFALIQVPSTDGRGAFQDPSHVSYWNENSFLYYTHRGMAKHVPKFKGRFQKWFSRSYVPKGLENMKIVVTDAHLLALKPPYDQRPVGGIHI